MEYGQTSHDNINPYLEFCALDICVTYSLYLPCILSMQCLVLSDFNTHWFIQSNRACLLFT